MYSKTEQPSSYTDEKRGLYAEFVLQNDHRAEVWPHVFAQNVLVILKITDSLRVDVLSCSRSSISIS